MRIPAVLLIAFLLATPVLLLPAQGAPVVDACVGHVCAVADDSGRASAAACVEGAGACAAAAACVSVDCAAVDACADAGPIADTGGLGASCVDLATPGLLCTESSCAPDPCATLGVCEPIPDLLPPLDRFPGPVVGPFPCRNPVGISMIADEPDNFGSPAPTSPGTDLQNWMNTLGGAQRGFDQWGSNARFGHTLTGLGGNVIAATLTIHLHATSDIPGNDGIALQMAAPGVFSWAGSIATEAAAQGQSWPTAPSGGYADVTLNLDLGAAPHDLRSSIGSLGRLDVYVQDDTVVDYIGLTIWWCRCDQVSVLVEQGTNDAFVGPEPTTYRWATQPRQYDQGGADLAFATTLKVPHRECLMSGWVEIQTRVEDSLVSTDWIHLQNPTGSGFLHSQAAPTGPWHSVHTVTIPLSAAILSDIDASGAFDVYVQDDTAIDYVRLILNYG